MRGVVDGGPGVVAALVSRDLVGASDEPDGRGVGQERQRVADVGVRNRVVVAIEPDVRELAGDDWSHQVGLEGMRGQRQEPRLLFREDLGDRPVPLLGMETLVSDVVPPARTLRVEVLDIPKGTGGEESVAEVADLPLDFTFGESCQLRLITPLRSEFSASPIHSTL